MKHSKIVLLIFYRTIFISLVISVCGCANVVAPTGGDRDILPPKIISTFPPNLTTKFKSKEIRISLSEFFILNNPSEEIYLSPVSILPLKWKTRKKNLIISLPDSLNENTTYTLQFGNSIADITEGNKLEGYSYVFSTGDVIDSLRIQGVLSDAKTQKPQKGFLVMLYSSTDDSVVAKRKPDYFARTDESGQFVLDYLHEGIYRLFCLSDKNLNYLYDQPNEEIAFVDTMISVHDTTAFYSLNSFLPTTDKTVLLSASTSDNKKISFAFNHEVKDFSIKTTSDSTQILYQSNNSLGDTVNVWIESHVTDSIFFQLYFNNETDTVGIKPKYISASQQKGMSNKFTVRTNLYGSKNNYGLFPGQKFELAFSSPLKSISKEILATVVVDSASDFKKVLFLKRIDTISHQSFSFCNYDFQSSVNYKILIPAGLFEDVYGNKNDSMSFQFRKLDETAAGNLALTINCKDSMIHYVAQFYFGNSLSKEWELQNGENVFNLKSLLPGVYKLQFIRDENKNGKWDSGNYWKKKQPEKIILYNKEITVRPNWDLEIEAEVGSLTSPKKKK